MVKKPYLYLLISFLFGQLKAQELLPKKPDHSLIYFDSLLLPCKAELASYYGFIPAKNYFLNSQPLLAKSLKHKFIYTPFSDTTFETALRPLNGELVVHPHQTSEKKFDHFYVFNLGTLTQLKEPSKKGTQVHTYYLDSLKNGDQNTFTRYTSENDIPVFKQYLNKNGNKSFSDKIYLGEHKSFTGKWRPILGLYWNMGPEEEMKRNSRTFLEVGITKKYLKGTYVKAVKRTYYDNIFGFHAVSASLLGTSRGDITYLGQKVTYSYTYLFFKGEAGILNYTDLSGTDPRFIGGLGFTVIGSLSGMFYYSIPLTKNEFKDLGRIAVGFSFH